MVIEPGRREKQRAYNYKHDCVSNKREVIRFPSQQLISKAMGRNSAQSGLGVGNFFFFLISDHVLLLCRGVPGRPRRPEHPPSLSSFICT